MLKLSNGVMFRVPVEVQDMQLQAVVDTAAQVTLVSEEFCKSLDHAGEVIPMSLGAGSPLVNEKETGLSLVKGCKVPPNSVKRVGHS